MPSTLDCPRCASKLQLPDAPPGSRIRCPSCLAEFAIPGPPAAAEIGGGPGNAAADWDGAAPSRPDFDTASTESAAFSGAAASPGPPAAAASAPSESAAGPATPQIPVAQTWWLRTPEGLVYGPADFRLLEQWVREGRVTADCDLRSDVDSVWRSADRQFPAVADPRIVDRDLVRAVVAGSMSSTPPVPANSVYQSSVGGQAGAAGGSVAAVGAGAGHRSSLFVAGAARRGHEPAAEPRREDVAGSQASVEASSSSAPEATPLRSTLPSGVYRPHRGAVILVMGLVGLVAQCPVFSVMAWVMGTSDLDEIRAGRMDPEGEGSTKVGRMLGMLVSLFWVIIAVVATLASLVYVAARY